MRDRPFDLYGGTVRFLGKNSRNQFSRKQYPGQESSTIRFVLFAKKRYWKKYPGPKTPSCPHKNQMVDPLINILHITNQNISRIKMECIDT